MSGNFVLLQESEHSNFSTVSSSFIETFWAHFNSGISVQDNGTLDELNNLWVNGLGVKGLWSLSVLVGSVVVSSTCGVELVHVDILL